MIYEASEFTFTPPPQVGRARRVLIKPLASCARPYPWTTSKETLEKVITGIRKVSEADIIIIEGEPEGKAMGPIYRSLGYNFPRVLTMDVKDTMWVEIENPLPKPFVLQTVWVPNILLSCDYWITVTPFKIVDNMAQFTIPNLLGLLPVAKYRKEELYAQGIEKIIADLYFTLPFDMGILDAWQKFTVAGETGEEKVEEYGKIIIGEPFEVDEIAAREAGCELTYLELIRSAKAEFVI